MFCESRSEDEENEIDLLIKQAPYMYVRYYHSIQ